MPTTKLIYGVGRVPKASEFSLGEIIVNVDDSKVYSKNKSNIVFEIGSGGTTIIGGESDGLGFATASISASGFFTSADTSNLIISGGTGVSVTTGSNNQIIITATGDSEVTNAITASYAHTAKLAYTASYVNTSNLDGNLFEFANDGAQGGIIFDESNVDIYSTVGAYAAGLSETSNVTFAQVSSSGLLFASASEETTGGDNIRAVVYDTASGQFYYTGSYGGGGGDNGDWYDGITFLSSSVPIRVSGSVSSSRLILDSTVDLRNASDELFIYATGITGDSGVTSLSFPVGAGNSFTLLDDTMLSLSVGAGATNVNIGASTSTTTIADDLKVLGSVTASNDISASGDIIANDFTGSSALIGNLRIVGDKIQPSATSLTSLEIDANDARIQFDIGGAQYFKIDKQPDTSEFVLGNPVVSSSFTFYTKGFSSTPAFYITSSGNVGIGTISPNEKLEVVGNISSSGYLRLNANDNTTGVAGALMYSSSNEFYLGFS